MRVCVCTYEMNPVLHSRAAAAVDIKMQICVSLTFYTTFPIRIIDIAANLFHFPSRGIHSRHHYFTLAA